VQFGQQNGDRFQLVLGKDEATPHWPQVSLMQAHVEIGQQASPRSLGSASGGMFSGAASGCDA